LFEEPRVVVFGGAAVSAVRKPNLQLKFLKTESSTTVETEKGTQTIILTAGRELQNMELTWELDDAAQSQKERITEDMEGAE